MSIPFEDLSLRPITFFTMEFECHRFDKTFEKAHQLPSLCELTDDIQFANVFFGWNDAGLHCQVQSPSCERVELFIDTRNMKSAGFNTRFCHHFLFDYDGETGFTGEEITKFRTEDAHELCLAQDLACSFERKKNRIIDIHIPTHCLHGYDPEQSNALGFHYRLTSRDSDLQHFGIITDEFAIEQQPALWNTLRLT